MTLRDMQDIILADVELEIQNKTTMAERVAESFAAWYQGMANAAKQQADQQLAPPQEEQGGGGELTQAPAKEEQGEKAA